MRLVVEIANGTHFIVKRPDTRAVVFRGNKSQVEDYLDRHDMRCRKKNKPKEERRVSS